MPEAMTKRKLEDFQIGEHVLATGRPEKGTGFVVGKSPRHVEVEWSSGEREHVEPFWLDGTNKGLLDTPLDKEAGTLRDTVEPKWTGLNMIVPHPQGDIPVKVSSEPDSEGKLWATLPDGSPAHIHKDLLDADWAGMAAKIHGLR